mmetsp:Transcript_37890/g.61103  ORF Transcript_37890/g.61103 Transcript_37890/m.61103 type:complete len:112 (-) Transcript_37890:147-482(-)
MGAAQSLHMLSDPELCEKLAGVFAMSTFLSDDSVLPERVKKHTSAGGRVPPVLWFHGTADPMIQLRWTEASYPRMQAANVSVDWRTWQGVEHDMRRDELQALHLWLTSILY